MAINLKHGAWRLWVVLSVIWVLAVGGISIGLLFDAQPWKGGKFVIKKDEGVVPRPYYGETKELMDEAVKRGLFEGIEFSDNSVLLVRKDNSDSEKQKLKDQYLDFRFWARAKSIGGILAAIVSFPIITFIFGLLVMWVARGFVTKEEPKDAA